MLKQGQIQGHKMKLNPAMAAASKEAGVRFFKEAEEKYSASLALQSVNTTSYTTGQGKYNLGLAQFHHCKIFWDHQDGGKKQKADQEAFAKLAETAKETFTGLQESTKGKKVVQGNIEYMLACIEGMLGREKHCKKWLQACS